MKLNLTIFAMLLVFLSLNAQQKGYSLGNTVEDFDMDIIWPDGTSNKTSVYEIIDQNTVIVFFFGSPG